MTLGTWNPDTGLEKLAYRVDAEVLARCAAFADLAQWHTLADWEKSNLPASAPQMMKLAADDWAPVLQQLDSATLVKLVQFFTVAEHLLPHWHGGDKSPVIWISRTLKQRGEPLSRDMVLWIKANSDNRFLPNGPIL